MQASLDELARMRDLVSAGKLPTSAAELLRQIRGLSSGKAPQEPAPHPPPRPTAPASAAAPALHAVPTPPPAPRPTPAALEESAMLTVSEDSISNLEISNAPVLQIGRASCRARV